MMRWFYRSFQVFLFAVALVLTLGLAPAWSQSPFIPVAGNQVDGYPIELDGKTVFQVRQGIPGVVSAQERAKIINERLQAIANDYAIAPTDIRAENKGEETIVKAGDIVLLTVRKNDVEGLDQPQSQVTATLIQKLQTAVADYREARTIHSILRGIFFAIAGTIILLVVLQLTQQLVAWLRKQIHVASNTGLLGVQVQNLRILSPHATEYVLMGLLQLLRLGLFLLVFLFCGSFPILRR
jgi:hypothetical protein